MIYNIFLFNLRERRRNDIYIMYNDIPKNVITNQKNVLAK
jgi:hypothetical protein